jgi:hypothetical protein
MITNFACSSGARVLVLALGLGSCANSSDEPANLDGGGGGRVDATSTSARDGARDAGYADLATRTPTSDERRAAKQAIESFIEGRTQASPPAVTELADRLTQQGFGASDVEELVRSGPIEFPALPEGADSPIEHVLVRDITCFHANYSTRYFQYVPKSYDPARKTPLVVVGHGGNSAMSSAYAESTAKSYISAYRVLADGALGAILVAPATTVGWGPLGDVLIESVISKTIRDFNIDPDRIYITGQSMGGHLTWRSAMNHGDRFAGFSPQSGGYATYIDDHSIENLFGTVGYVTYGSTEPYDLNTTNDLLGAWLTNHHYPWIIVKKTGGHEIYSDEIPKMGDLFAAHARDLYQGRTFLHAVGELQYPNSTTASSEAIPGRVLRWNFRNWIEIVARPDSKTGATFYGESKGAGRLEILSDGVRHLNVLLHPRLVDMSKNVTIVVNGESKWTGVPAPEIGQLLDRVREFDDRGRIFHASIPIEVSTDATVPTPTYP